MAENGNKVFDYAILSKPLVDMKRICGENVGRKMAKNLSIYMKL